MAVLYGHVLDHVFDVKVFSQALAVIVQPFGLLADSVNGLLHLLGVLLHLEEGGRKVLVVRFVVVELGVDVGLHLSEHSFELAFQFGQIILPLL